MSTKFELMMPGELAKELDEITNAANNYAMDKKVIYLASPWFDTNALMLHDAVRVIEKCVCSKYKIYYPKDHNEKYPEDTFNSNTSAISSCDVLIALISRKDVGTAWEIGYATAIGKKIYLVAFDEDCFTSKTNLMLAFSGRCFTIDKLAKFLVEGLDSVDYIHTDRKWEEIE